MAKEKKRLNKSAKAAVKLLKDSKLLAAKTQNDPKSEQNFKAADSPVKTSAPNKMRPSKKRG